MSADTDTDTDQWTFTAEEWQAAYDVLAAADWFWDDERGEMDPPTAALFDVLAAEGDGNGDGLAVHAALLAAREVHGDGWTPQAFKELAGGVVYRKDGWAGLGEDFADNHDLPLSIIALLVGVGQCDDPEHQRYTTVQDRQEAGLAALGREDRRETEVYVQPDGDGGPLWIFRRPR